MNPYISPIDVRIRRHEKAMQNVDFRINSIRKLTQSIAQSFLDGMITKTEADIALSIHQKVLDALQEKTIDMQIDLIALKEERS